MYTVDTSTPIHIPEHICLLMSEVIAFDTRLEIPVEEETACLFMSHT